MIETVGDYKKTNHSKEELISLLEKGILEAKKAFINFVNLLDINPIVFSHLENIKLIIDYTDQYNKNDQIAFYISTDEDNNNRRREILNAWEERS